MNFGIIPVVIDDEMYEKIKANDTISLDLSNLDNNEVKLEGVTIKTSFTKEEIETLKKGGLLNTI